MSTPSHDHTSVKPEQTRRFGVWALVVLLLGLAFHVLVAVLHLWDYLAVPAARNTFLDLRFMLVAFDAVRDGVDVHQSMPAGEWHPVYNYPRYWMMLRFTGLNASHTDLVGWVLAAAVLAAMVDVVRPRNRSEAAIALALVVSPAVLFATERGNLDVLILILVWGGWRFLRAAPGTATLAGATACLAAATLLKIYPVAALPVAALRAHRTHAARWVAGAVSVTIAAAVLEWWSLRDLLPEARGRYAYGARLFFDYLDISPPGGALLAGALAVGGIVLLTFAWARTLPWPATQTGSELAHYLGASILGLCLIAGTGFDYRFVFAAFLLPLLLDLIAGAEVRLGVLAAGTTALLLVVMWAEPIDLYTRVLVRRLGATQETALALQPYIHAAEHGLSWLAVGAATGLGLVLLERRLTAR